MPTYEYECKKCKKRFECFQKITDAPLKKCNSCEGEVKRIIGSGVGIIFKGSGFYVNDYKNKGKADSGSRKASDSESKKASDSESKKTVDSELKKASDSEPKKTTDSSTTDKTGK